MKFDVVEESYIEDGSKRYLIDIESQDQNYFAFIFEAFEGWCIHTMAFKNEKPLLQMDVVPDFIISFEDVLNFLRKF